MVFRSFLVVPHTAALLEGDTFAIETQKDRTQPVIQVIESIKHLNNVTKIYTTMDTVAL